jgi:hypothetical protein
VRKGGLIIPVKKNKKSLTNENLILLHLLENYHYRDKFIAPESVTQKGIKKNCKLRYQCYLQNIKEKCGERIHLSKKNEN